MPRVKKQLTPKDVPKIEKPTQGIPKGRPRTQLSVRDFYMGTIVGGLIGRAVGVTLTPEHMQQIKDEANIWADFMLDPKN